MKTIICIFFLLLASYAPTSIAIEGINPADIVQTVDFKGPPEYRSTAAIVNRKNADGFKDTSLLIVHTDKQMGKTSIVVENPNVGLNDGSAMIEKSTLSIGINGSLQVTNQNFSVGRAHYEETLTIVYRDHTYLVAGITIFYSDNADLSDKDCDYNLLTGKTISSYSVDGKIIKNNVIQHVQPQKIEVKNFRENTKLNACEFI